MNENRRLVFEYTDSLCYSVGTPHSSNARRQTFFTRWMTWYLLLMSVEVLISPMGSGGCHRLLAGDSNVSARDVGHHSSRMGR